MRAWPGKLGALGFRGVRWRLTVAVGLLFAVALIGGAALFLERIEGALIDDVHDVARIQLERVRSTIAEESIPLPSDLPEPPEPVDSPPSVVGEMGLGDLRVIESQESLILVARAGSPAGSFSERSNTIDGDAITSAQEVRTEILASGEPIPEWLAAEEGRIAVSSLSTDTPRGRVELVSASPLDAVQRTVDTSRRVVVVAVPVLVGLIGLTTWHVAGRALRPVEAMTRRADEIGAVTPDTRLPVPETRDEVAHLARTLNGMLDRLDQTASAQRRFTADAAHELRTPISTIRTELEVALRDHDPDWSSVAERALAEDARLGALVDDLLLLAQDDEVTSSSRYPFGDVDLDTVALDSVGRRPHTAIGTTGVAPARIKGDAVELGRAVDHLLDNALRHAKDAVEVRVDTGDDGTVVLDVDDDGAGIPEGDRGRVLERFARLDEARARDHGGAGLGLAVVDRIMTRHGGGVVISDSPLGGARVSLLFPSATSFGVGGLPNSDRPSGDYAF